MKQSTRPVILFLLLAITQSSWGTDTLWESLTAMEREELDHGKQILVTEEVPHAIWPRFHIYRLISASPREIEAVFWDISDHPNYIPDCTKVVIDRHQLPNTLEATYSLNVPLLSQESSQVRTEVTSLPCGIYSNRWTILSSKYSEAGDGSFLIVPHRSVSLVCYTSFVIPKSSIASLLRHPAENRLQQTVKSIAQRVEYELREDPGHHAKQLKELDAALERVSSSASPTHE
jgi:hypothetical protein